MRFAGILFDFDGVLLESEHASNRNLATYLTGLGHPITPEEAMARFMGLAGADFLGRVADFIGRPLPDEYHSVSAANAKRSMAKGLPEVVGATAFIRGLPADLPVAVVSSSPTAWLHAHLAHLGLTDRFGDHVYSGREHVARGKPAPDLYLYAADALGIDIARAAILEDSPVGATGAVASGAFVIGLCAGSHCGAGHADRLRALGVQAVAGDFAEVQRIVSASPGAI